MTPSLTEQVKVLASEGTYAAAFHAECLNEYPLVDAFEQRTGYAIDRVRLESAARVLACPLKKSPPNWQHGRVIYAATRARCAKTPHDCFSALDIGTAKGFSALCLKWAISDHVGAIAGSVYSVDVIDPEARVRRNTVAEVDRLQTLAEMLAPWPHAAYITFECSTGVRWLQRSQSLGPIDVAFVDGKHSQSAVLEEGLLLSEYQRPGDLAIFDDVHIPGVWDAVKALKAKYELERLQILPNRAYAIGVRRG